MKTGMGIDMGVRTDLTGRIFGDLTVIRLSDKRSPRGNRTVPLWECKCVCQSTVYRATDTLKRASRPTCAACSGKRNAARAREHAGFFRGTQISKISSNDSKSSNICGFRGVYYDPRSGKYRARLKFKGKNLNFGYYSSFDDAVRARKAAELEYFGAILSELDQMAEGV